MAASHTSTSTGFSTTGARVAILAILGAAVCFPGIFQPLLNQIWDYLRQSGPYRSSTFETFWTVFCYAAIEVPLTVAFMRHPEWRLAHQHDNVADRGKEQTSEKEPPKKPKGMRRPARRGMEALVYVAPLLTLDLLMIKKFAGVPLEDMLRSGNYDVPSMHDADNFGLHKAHFLVPSVHNFSLNSPLQTKRALPLEAPSSRRLALELITSLVLYDALFFAFHLSLHVIPGLKAWHKPHHKHGEMHPQITNQLHVFERLGLVLLANFSLNIIGSHVLTRTLFVPIFVWLLVEIHSGLDLPWAYDKILPAGWGGGARKHAAHHREGETGMEPYFNWCDDAWEAVSERWRVGS
ncbi:hypothetical protein KC331_g19355 [Hortaea werneckii]|uniref:Fatty acid hydroxylase domain-containing protein n=1 Tax=Hortaea werneckii TaxID=91943 RepID=A0A3M7C3I8_HORWE|nr:hypothetical protein KC331_g19355 [Hortaea werneckii]KAI7691150.1 hypothetical protein KC353_g19141 [Hortaea werneckii]RMY46579.1 hypothetical protein D0865_09200 [Hortaea werneckii]